MSKAMILDRDGTINVEKNYLYKPEDLEFLENVPQAIRILNDLGYKVIVITNQSGIARGFYTENDLQSLHKYIDKRLQEYGAKIDAYYYCPHHLTDGIGEYRIDCNCRKPRTGMYERAIKDFDIDAQASWVVGDRVRDLIPADRLGMKKALVLTGYGESERSGVENGTPVFRDLADFAGYLQKNGGK